jgi:hypothetical protein
MSLGMRPAAAGAVSLAVVVLTTGSAGWSQTSTPSPTPAWGGFAADAQHTGSSAASPQPLTRVHWQAPVDRQPVTFPPDGTFAHYPSPLITSTNTVIVPTRIGKVRGFELVAYAGSDGTRKWRMPTDYTVPNGASPDFPPPLPASLVDDQHVAVAGAGGTVLIRSKVDGTNGQVRRVAFYGIDHYRAHRAAYRQAVQITTPLTTGPDGSLYFGFQATADAPGRLRNGVARISRSGEGSWVPARGLGKTSEVTHVMLSCAPALSPDGSTAYVAVATGEEHALLTGFDTATMRPKYRHVLRDPQTHNPALLVDQSSATPTVGPDGDVFYGVLGNPIRRHDDRGWLLHFDARLSTVEIPGSFGWDQTVAVVPASSVPSYAGSSSYLLVSKYNNYLLGPHGDGRMEIALLDPHAAQRDRFSRVQVMREVRTALSPVHIPHSPPGTGYEWCINAVAVDPVTGSAIANNEDGHLYRWDLDTGQLAENIRLGEARGQAYTETLIGPDGTSYAIQTGVLYAVGS